jgi:hypothetical protein
MLLVNIGCLRLQLVRRRLTVSTDIMIEFACKSTSLSVYGANVLHGQSNRVVYITLTLKLSFEEVMLCLFVTCGWSIHHLRKWMMVLQSFNIMYPQRASRFCRASHRYAMFGQKIALLFFKFFFI